MSDRPEPAPGDALYVEAKHDGASPTIVIVGEFDMTGVEVFWAHVSPRFGASLRCVRARRPVAARLTTNLQDGLPRPHCRGDRRSTRCVPQTLVGETRKRPPDREDEKGAATLHNGYSSLHGFGDLEVGRAWEPFCGEELGTMLMVRKSYRRVVRDARRRDTAELTRIERALRRNVQSLDEETLTNLFAVRAVLRARGVELPAFQSWPASRPQPR